MRKSFTVDSITRAAGGHLIAVALSLAVLFLFAALTYSQITLPRYATNHSQKDAQQVVNLVVAILAAVIGILLTHCLRLTNEAETAAELRRNQLTIPRLHTHVEAAGGSKTAIVYTSYQNQSLVFLAVFYLFAVTVFGVLNSVLSVIFVVESVVSNTGEQVPAYISLSADVPLTHNGVQLDPCRGAFANPGCTYDLALTSLSSELVTFTPYTIGGVTFQSPNGTMGLPYWAFEHFSNQVRNSQFDNEYRQYCLPVLNPHLIKCEEQPFVQAWAETNSSEVLYQGLEVYLPKYLPPNFTKSVLELTPLNAYRVVLDYPSNETSHFVYRSNDQAKGVMSVAQMPLADQQQYTIITAADSGGQGYASLLHQMMYGNFTTPAYRKENPGDKIVAKCFIPSLYNTTAHSSWRQVNFNMKGGILTTNVTDELCPSPRGPTYSGFSDLFFALEGAASILGGSDGYTKILNNNTELGLGSDIFHNMSRLDAAVNKIYHLVQTSYSQTSHEYAMQNESIFSHPIIMTNYPHRYVIRISWTPTTYIGLVLALLIAGTAMTLAARWLLAIYRLGGDRETWNLLRPVDLMAYSLAAYQDLIHDLNTIQHRKEAMRETHGITLKEYPITEGTESLIGLVNSASPTATQRSRVPQGSLNSHLNTSIVTSPFGTLKEKQPRELNLGVTVEERDSGESKSSREGEEETFLNQQEPPNER